ncbi:MAG: CoA transferase, partial [Candidatus Wallbacteria bacterium]|nr:CoA transferase [Candidatus Wallbacteria bacterium]
GREDLSSDPRFVDNKTRCEHHPEMEKILSEIFLKRSTTEWIEFLDRVPIPCTAISTIADVVKNPQLSARNMFAHVDQPGMGDLMIAGNPIKMTDTEDPTIRRPAPSLGEQTDKVLIDLLGYTTDEVVSLRKSGVL